MRIEQLEYLAAVTEHGSLRRAGEHLHLSQPALSEALTKLERELRVTLLERRRSGTRISEEGRQLLPHMHEVLDAVDRLRDAARGSVGRPALVRVGSVPAAAGNLVVPAVQSFRRQHPSTAVDVVTLEPARIDDALVRGALDIGLVDVLDGDTPSADVEGLDLLRGRPLVVLPAGHRLSRNAEVTTDELREEPLVMTRAGHVMHRYLRLAFGGELPASVHTTDAVDVTKALVAEGLGVAVLPDYAVAGGPLHRAGLLEVRPVAGVAPVFTLQLRQRRAARPTPAVRGFVAALRGRAAHHLPTAVSR